MPDDSSAGRGDQQPTPEPQAGLERQAVPLVHRSTRLARRAANFTNDLGRATAARIDRATRSTRTARVIADLEDRAWAFRRERKVGKGTLRATYVVAYRGYVAEERAYVRVRVMEEPVFPAAADALPNAALVRANVRRFFALAFPGVHVRISMGSLLADAITDRHGFATAQVPAINLEPGWHNYECTTIPVDIDEPAAHAIGEVLVPDPAARVSVISDVDDTVLRTGMSEGFVAVRNTLLGTANTRRAVPGMAALYRALNAHAEEDTRPSFFYVSTGPWNLYDMLSDFLAIRGFPDGPLFLTDWAPQERYVVRSGQGHKRATIARLFSAYPDSKFALFGDSGQKDPETYVEVARENPGRIAAIIIRDVGDHMADRAAELAETALELQSEGVPFYFVSDATAAAAALLQLGLLTDDGIKYVRAEMDADPEPEDEAAQQVETDTDAAADRPVESAEAEPAN